MLILLPLLSALSAAPALASSFSGSEKRTLQAAISSALHSAELNRFYLQCKEQPKEGEVSLVVTDKEQPRMLAMLQQKVHTQDLDLLLKADKKLSQTVKRGILTLKSCDDSKALQQLLDNYEVALFSLDIAMPLERPLTSKATSSAQRSAQAQSAVSQLIARSHAIALVNIVEKQQLNAVQQANHLHPDYSSSYIFKVQHGWRGNVAAYLGMHVFVSDADMAKTEKQWLVFIDKNGHFIQAIAASQAQPYLAILKDAEWRYDTYGNLHRNK